jgi:hypothetical protein
VDSAGAANNNNANNAYGFAPDSVRCTKCRLLATDAPDTEGESILPALPENISLDTSGRTLLAWALMR